MGRQSSGALDAKAAHGLVLVRDLPFLRLSRCTAGAPLTARPQMMAIVRASTTEVVVPGIGGSFLELRSSLEWHVVSEIDP